MQWLSGPAIFSLQILIQTHPKPHNYPHKSAQGPADSSYINFPTNSEGLHNKHIVLTKAHIILWYLKEDLRVRVSNIAQVVVTPDI